MAQENQLLNPELQGHRAQIDEIFKDLHDLTVKTSNEELTQTVSDLRNRIHEPFMFVIVGEVKSGKSSFINALLATGKDVTQVAPQPMTDTIQQILYGDKEETITLNPFLKQIFLPEAILKEIAIVDTPGTNTIIENHQTITERFIPASDLIVFVFEAKNPYRQSAWDFFDYIHEDWKKKIIFILQQKDLMDETDLEINLKGVRDYAEKKGVQKPKVYAVSAKQEQAGDTENSGFEPVREYITTNITGGKAPVLKLENNIETAENIIHKIGEGLDLRRRQWEADKEFRADIHETLENQELKSLKQVDILVENLIGGYDRIANEKANELSAGLSFFGLLRRSVASIFNRKASAKEWLENLARELEVELNSELREKLSDGVTDLADSIQQMAKLIDLKIRASKTILSEDTDIFADIAERRSNIMNDLQEAFNRFLSRTENFADNELFPSKTNLSPNLATGSGIAAIGIILATVTQASIFDITGGILTTIGLLFAGISTQGKRRQIINGFKRELQEGREQLETDVEEKLKAYITNLKEKIERNFERFDLMLEQERTQIEKLSAQQTSVEQRLDQVKEDLQAMV